VACPDSAPDVEGSFASALVTMPDPADASKKKMINSTCFYVQVHMDRCSCCFLK